MIILFWNIGKRFSEKSGLLNEILEDIKPDIFCIAEGSDSTKECEKINEIASQLNYKCYYSPIIGQERLNLKYNKLGLKIFYNSSVSLLVDCGFEHQRENGRIINMKIRFNNKNYLFVFLHNYSKHGGREVTDRQRLFISSINAMFKLSKVSKPNDNIVIVGDFNLEPWDNILRTQGYLQTCFLGKHYEIAARTQNNSYYNPIIENIIDSKLNNLAGSFYSLRNGWALYDYPLYDRDKTPLKYKIITQTSKRKLLNSDDKITKQFLDKDIDHLPIIMELLKN